MYDLPDRYSELYTLYGLDRMVPSDHPGWDHLTTPWLDAVVLKAHPGWDHLTCVSWLDYTVP